MVVLQMRGDSMINIKGIEPLVNIFRTNGYQLYAVGGWVRDTIMGINAHDLDMCTNAEPREILNLLKYNNIQFHMVGIEFGTVTAILDGVEYEITTFRKESGYADSRHPSKIEWSKSLSEDIARRDFTINAIAYDLINEKVIDLVGGIEDIKNKVLRTVGNALDRVTEDPLRIVRGIRFAIKYGLTFDAEQDFSKIAIENMHLLDNISNERKTEELQKILSLNKPISDNELFKAMVLRVIPQLKVCDGVDQNNKYHKHDVLEHIFAVMDYCDTDDWRIKLSALLHDIGKPASKTTDGEGWSHYYGHPQISYELTREIVRDNLKLCSKDRKLIEDLVLNHDMVISSDKKLKMVLGTYGEEFLNCWFVLKGADQADHVYPEGSTFCQDIDDLRGRADKIIEESSCLTIKDMAISGRDIMKLKDLKQGKIIGTILNRLLYEILDNKLENTSDALQKRVIEMDLSELDNFNEI